MPELPEVETIKEELRPHLEGRTFAEVLLPWPPLVRGPSPEEIRRRLPGQQVLALSRRGKFLVLCLSSGQALLLHLGMTGSLLIRPPGAAPDTYTRAMLRLDNGSQLFFVDPRKFGSARLVDDEGQALRKLGPEPLDSSFTPEVLAQRLARRKAPLKAVLLDQAFLAGVGNIYSDEALFQAGLHPLRAAGSLSAQKVARLHRAIREVLRMAIAHRGSSVDTYRRPSGEDGSHQRYLQVYGREGQPCLRCGTPIQREKLRGRGTHFCPRCQK